MQLLKQFKLLHRIYKGHGYLTALFVFLRYGIGLYFLRSDDVPYPPLLDRGKLRLEPRRDWICKLLDKERELVGAEIGVDEGEHARYLFDTLNLKKLYLIDPYTIESKSREKSNSNQCDSERIAKSKFQNIRHVEFIKKLSVDASQDIPNNLDFVYIDGDHWYKSIKKDIKIYYPKLNSGGILAGHDYNEYFKFDVVKAVDEFARDTGLNINNDLGDDWYVVKPV